MSAVPESLHLHWKSLGIGAKLTLAFGALAGVTVMVATLAFVAGRRATDDIVLTESVRGPASLASAQAQASLLRMQLHVRGYLVLSDPTDIEQYQAARRAFEQSLASLQAMSANWPEGDAARSLAELNQTYARWLELPQQLFELHDNPLQNRPALRLARVEVQGLRVQIMDGIDSMIELQKKREDSARNRQLLADLLGFQTTFDAMATNLMAYGASGELNFKLGYGPQLATNAAIWNTLSSKNAQLSAEQRARLTVIAQQRAAVAELALRIVAILNGEHAYEDLYLYRTQVAPQAEALLELLSKVTAQQQGQLQSGLARARQSLATAQLQTGAGGLLAVAFAVAMVFLFRRNIVGPVHRLTGVAEQVAAGDLTARAALESHDEIGVLATSINTMTQRLAETIAHLETVFAEAQRAKDAAEVANRAKSTFLATMSHELRTPLNAVLGYAQILQREPGLNERATTGLATIRRSGEHLLALINSVLDLARIEAGKVELFPDSVSLPGLLRNVTDVIRINAQDKDLMFSFEAPHDLPSIVRADEKRLGQVLLNLLSNAVKFTERGRVSLRVQRLASSDDSACLRFAVEDTGIGIAHEQIATIFRPFEQASEVQRRYGGTGLGLSISRQLVGLMGGEIHVESELGRGSRFWFDLDLPLAHAASPLVQTAQDDIISGYRGPRRKVLVVDDVVGNRATLIDLLAPLGFEMYQAEDGESGLQQALALQPDLILMDTVMPGMDGLETTRQMRLHSALRKVPVIAVSASASAADQQRSLACGANVFLSKPIDLDTLLAEIGSLMQLEWIRQARPASPAIDAVQAPLVTPPAQELEVLYHLAKIGNMHSIRLRADHLATLDAAYLPFAQRLRHLADRFQSRAILDWVSRLRNSSSGRESQPPARPAAGL